MAGSPTLSPATTPTEALLPRPFGHVELLRLIARGERGDVFIAQRFEGTSRTRAVKVLPGSAAAEGALLAALGAEAPALVRRLHGNLVHMEDVGEADDKVFFESEFVEGRDLGTMLEKLLSNRRRLPSDVAVLVAVELAAAAAYLRHSAERGVAGGSERVPLGIQPHATLLSMDGDVKLLHYGTTMSAALLPRAGDVPAQRASYVAPEVLKRGQGGATADVFALGALLWEMLAGRPVAGDDPQAHLAALAGGSFKPPKVSSVVPGIAPELDATVTGCLEPDPANRPRTCDYVRSQLARVLRSFGRDAPVRLAALMRDLFAAEVAIERQEIAELGRAADAARAGRGVGGRASSTTLTKLGKDNRQRVAVPLGGDLPSGQVIAGTRYRAIAKIGEGGMGSVYAAEHVDIEKKVALKLLKGELSRSPEMLQQFRQEARAASRIGNPFICDVTDFGEVLDGRVFFVMEYLDGLSLGGVLRGEKRLPIGRAVGILRQVCKALGAAHEKGIVHLDVKPDNVMLLDRGGRHDAVKVVDFGIAGLLGASGGNDTVSGTPEYVAPERAIGRGYDHRSDIYSLGAMAYEMLTGQLPFQGKDVVATLTMQVKDPVVPPRKRAPEANVPPAIEAWVLRLLSKDPGGRPGSMAEVEAELCEAQIAAGLRTEWDDLDLPAVDEPRRQRLADGMPSPGAGKRKLLVWGAVGLAAMGASLAIFAVTRKPSERVVEVKVSEDPAAVRAWLDKADEAIKGRHFTSPEGESAYDYVVAAEEEAARRGAKSPGALQRRRYAGAALTALGDELNKVGLPELAVARWKEALMFLPDNSELKAKAKLQPGERVAVLRAPRDKSGARAPRPAQPADEARRAAVDLVEAAVERRFSEARLAAGRLTTFDPSGVQRARIADRLRERAKGAWEAQRYTDSQPLYELVVALDPRDVIAAERARPEARPSATPSPSSEAVAPAAGKARKEGGGGGGDDAQPMRRDPKTAARESKAGAAALAAGKLTEAEQAFARAVAADPGSAAAVGGLAEVWFERARYSEAMDYARRASRLAPKSSRHHLVMGDALFKLLRYGEALDAYERAQALSPGDAAIGARIERVSQKLGR